jgi:hypothetical protein
MSDGRVIGGQATSCSQCVGIGQVICVPTEGDGEGLVGVGDGVVGDGVVGDGEAVVGVGDGETVTSASDRLSARKLSSALAPVS